MADHMGELIRQYLDELAVLPSVDDDAEMRTAEEYVKAKMAEAGFDLVDIEPQLGRLRPYIAEEVARRRP